MKQRAGDYSDPGEKKNYQPVESDLAGKTHSHVLRLMAGQQLHLDVPLVASRSITRQASLRAWCVF